MNRAPLPAVSRAMPHRPAAPPRYQEIHVRLLICRAEESAWRPVAEFASGAAAEDEILSPSFPLRHGDVVRAAPAVPAVSTAPQVGPSFADRVADRAARARWESALWVFDGVEASGLVRVPSGALSVTGWENEQMPEALFSRCRGVDPRRLALAAADCVDIALSLPAGVASDVVETVRRWAEVGDPPPEAFPDPRETDGWPVMRDDMLALALWHLARTCREPWHSADAAAHAASSAWRADATADVADVRARMASAVRLRIPFPAVACAAVGLRDPLPSPRRAAVSP